MVRVAKVLRQELRESDTAARIGGDELVALLPQTTIATLNVHELRLFAEQDEDAEMSIADCAGRLVAARGLRPFASVDELRTRAHVPVHSIERLAAADAFRSMKLDRRAAL